MPRNVEIKARLVDPDRTLKLAQMLANTPPELILQTDIFFTCPEGRLKLRDFQNGSGELIAYSRPNAAGPKISSYNISPTADPAGLLTLLTAALGKAGTVRKTRKLLLAGRTRIHLDEVEDLGHFLELEVVLAEGESVADGEAEARRLMAELEIDKADLIEKAYIDLLSESTP
ncbi:MAG: class IV adenylate cyclase [Gemmatimonadales bacterium]|nr:class IV adenylate cyclase [Gemmatimonadales bacterium]